MRLLAMFLRCIAPVFFIAGAMHLVYGPQADVMLGANISPEVIADPALDSQNRFYGVAFSLYGALLLLCASNLVKYAVVLRCLLWILFIAGLTRFISIYFYGILPPLVMALFVSEVLLPPLVIWWMSRLKLEA
jgi:hypothetical protein